MTTTKPRIIIVGSGLAGLSAAIEAYRAPTKPIVIILEKEGNFGNGNSAKATSGINGLGSRGQQNKGIQDSIQKFVDDTIRSGKGRSVEALVRTLIQMSPDAIEFLESFPGIDLTVVSQCGGHSNPRTHRLPPKQPGQPPAPVGWTLVKTLREWITSEQETLKQSEEDKERIQIISGIRVAELVQNDSGKIIGVHTTPVSQPDKEEFIQGDAVILCTGGYSGDTQSENSLIRQYAPHLLGFPTTNGPFANGDGVRLGINVGADVVDMDQVQIHPTGFVDLTQPHNPTKFLAPEALRGTGGILVGQNGKRFANELDTRDKVTQSILDVCKDPNITPSSIPADENGKRFAASYLLMTQAQVENYDRAVIGFYHKKGLFKNAADLETFSSDTGVDLNSVVETMKHYDECAKGNSQDPFGKSVFPDTFEPTSTEGTTKVKGGSLYYCVITPSLHYSMGGLRFNTVGEILQQTHGDAFHSHSTKLIPGLYGAGEVTGGLHGGNRLAGNSLLETVVFGRIAGERASSILLASDPQVPLPLNPDTFNPLRFRERIKIGVKNTYIYRFDLLSSLQASHFKVGEYIAVRYTHKNEDSSQEEIIRYYSPINRPDSHEGYLDLLIKADTQAGKMSAFVSNLQPRSTELEFKGPISPPNLNLEFNPNVIRLTNNVEMMNLRKVALVCGGTGISPMIQVLRSIFSHNRRDLEVHLIYGASHPSEILFMDKLKEKTLEFPNFKVFFTVDKTNGEPWDGDIGFIDEEKIKKHVFPPSKDLKVMLCGPYPMCQALKPLFTKLGYDQNNFFSYM